MEGNNFKELLAKKEYEKCSNIIREKIINYVINKIRKYDEKYTYSTIEDLTAASKFYIKGNEKYIAELIEVESFEEESIDKLERLMELCEKFNIR